MGYSLRQPRSTVTGISVSSRLTLSLYYYHRHCQGTSLIFYLFFVSRLWVRTYGSRGRPRRPNPLRGKDLGQQHNTTTLECQVQIELFLGNSLDVARLTSMEDFTPFHDFGPLMPLAVWSVEDNANDTGRFSLKISHN